MADKSTFGALMRISGSRTVHMELSQNKLQLSVDYSTLKENVKSMFLNNSVIITVKS